MSATISPSIPRGWRLAPLSLCLLSACAERGAVAIGRERIEVYENSSGRLDEQTLRASLDGDDVAIELRLERRGTTPLPARLEVSLRNLTTTPEANLGSVTLEVVQEEAVATHTFRIPGAGAGLSRESAADLIIPWRVRLPAGDLHGRRSLYAALPKLEIELRGPGRLPAAGSAPFVVLARDPDSGMGLADVAVRALLTTGNPGAEQTTEIYSGQTDAAGQLVAPISMPEGIDVGLLRLEAQHGSEVAAASVSVTRQLDQRVYLASDKTLYQPGQDVCLRALALDHDGRAALANQPALFEALDGKGNKVFKRTLTTDDFGVASVTVPVDNRVNEGVWVFSVAVAGVKHELRLPVEHYNLPKMKLAFALDRDFVLAGETLSGHLDALYVFGRPVADAAVTVRAADGNDVVISTQSGTTNADGRFDFTLPIDASLGANETSIVTLRADLVDTAEQVAETERRLPLSQAPLLVTVVPELAAPLLGVENVVYVAVTDPLGRPVVANLTATGLAETSTDSEGIAELRVVPTSRDAELTLVATDGAGRRAEATFTLAQPGASLLVVRADRATYRPGDVATLDVFAPRAVERAVLVAYRGAVPVHAEAVALTEGRASLTTPVTEAMRGGVVLEVVAFFEAGKTLRGSRRIYVDSQDNLAVELSSDAASYAPGGEAEFRVSVRDEQGVPRVAAVGLTVVDDAVFQLGGEPNSRIDSFFADTSSLGPSALAGHNIADLLASAPSEGRERWAKLLLAGSPQSLAGIAHNSLGRELDAVQARLTPRLRADVQMMLEALAPRLDETELTYENAGLIVAQNVGVLLDPFGRTYRATPDTPSWGTVTVHSAGPDERIDSADDLSASIYYGWIVWSQNTCDGCGEWFADEDGAMAGGMPPNAAPGDPTAEQRADGASADSKPRRDFRETVYTNPSLITDASGQAVVRFPLADSITTWRGTAEASSTSASVGRDLHRVVTFQPFFVDFSLPTDLRRGDEVELRAVAYNYLDETSAVTISLEAGSWLTVLGNPTTSLSLGPSEVRSVAFRIRAEEAGSHELTLRAEAPGLADSVVRQARVAPDGKRQEQVFSDELTGSAEHTLEIPSDALVGGTEINVTLTPGFAAEAVQGTESMLREPGGCFEQTTASAWPNTLVTTYLQQTGQLTPELQERAFGLVTRGYQRLLTFESPTGGFNWWGDAAPGNRILSAIMLWHLAEMNGIIETDDAVRSRTLTWLVGQQRVDGSWAAGDALHAGNEVLGTSEVRSTAFIAWALAHTDWAPDAVERAAGYLRSHLPPTDDVYANALSMNALAKIEPAGSTLSTLMTRLDGLKVTREGDRVLWPTTAPSWTGASGDTAAIETTGLVAYGLLTANAYTLNATNALRFIVGNKDKIGTWYNTQATMNALRALSAAAAPQGSDGDGIVSISVDGAIVGELSVTPDTGDVVQRFDLAPFVGTGNHTVGLSFTGSGKVNYQLTSAVHRVASVAAPTGPFTLGVAWSATSASVGQTLTATATLSNLESSGSRDQVMVRLGRAPGLEPARDDLEALRLAGKVSRYEINSTDVTLYLMGVAGGEARVLPIRFAATLAMQATAQASRAYAYYEPNLAAETAPVTFQISE